MENSKRSIFKQKVYAKRYEVKLIEKTIPFFRVSGYYDYNYEYRIVESCSNFIEEKEIFICDLEMPLLEIGDKFYIEELNKLVTIKERYRTSKENVVYFIDDSLIENEQTSISKQEAEDQLIKTEELKNKFKELNEMIKKSIKEKDKEIETKDEIIAKYKNSFIGKFIK